MTTLKPKISIVTPSFNRGWSIRSCIQSLQRQSMTDYEHIIIDGCSTDDTLAILREAAASDSRIRFVSEPDRGMYDAINKGLSMASGDIVSYINTDDFYLPNALELVLKKFNNSHDIEMLYGHWVSWYPESSFVEILPVMNYKAADMAVYGVLPQPSVFFRRALFESLGGFDLTYKLLADNDFFSKAAVSGHKFQRIDDYLSVQTIHSGNLLAGNQSAILLANSEKARYLDARRKEFGVDFFRLVLLAKAGFNRSIFSIAWRCNLIFRLLLSAVSKTAETRLGLLSIRDAKFSFWILICYLLKKGGGHNYCFLKVGNADLSRHIKILLPSID
jgi:glycosyltransferase involved in cell wall biosynthesis